MKIICTEITKTPEGYKATITNGNGLRVHIEGCKTRKIAKWQAGERIKELKEAGIIKH
jgi:hypothetical protein